MAKGPHDERVTLIRGRDVRGGGANYAKDGTAAVQVLVHLRGLQQRRTAISRGIKDARRARAGFLES